VVVNRNDAEWAVVLADESLNMFDDGLFKS